MTCACAPWPRRAQIATPQLTPGQRWDRVVYLKPGVYRLWCTLPEHCDARDARDAPGRSLSQGGSGGPLQLPVEPNQLLHHAGRLLLALPFQRERQRRLMSAGHL